MNLNLHLVNKTWTWAKTKAMIYSHKYRWTTQLFGSNLKDSSMHNKTIISLKKWRSQQRWQVNKKNQTRHKIRSSSAWLSRFNLILSTPRIFLASKYRRTNVSTLKLTKTICNRKNLWSKLWDLQASKIKIAFSSPRKKRQKWILSFCMPHQIYLLAPWNHPWMKHAKGSYSSFLLLTSVKRHRQSRKLFKNLADRFISKAELQARIASKKLLGRGPMCCISPATAYRTMQPRWAIVLTKTKNKAIFFCLRTRKAMESLSVLRI